MDATCNVLNNVECVGPRTFVRPATTCAKLRRFSSTEDAGDVCSPPSSLRLPPVVVCCLAACRHGKFYFATALILSCFLGLFGADRFYLGFAGWGVLKLLSLGGHHVVRCVRVHDVHV